MNMKRLTSSTIWLGLAVAVAGFAVIALVLGASPVEAASPQFQGPPPPPPPPPPGPSAPDAEAVIKYKGTALVPEGPLPTKFTINGCAQVVRPDMLNLNEEPGFGAAYVQVVGVGQQVRVLAGPVGADGLWWWKFRSPEGKVGWGVGDYAEPSIAPCVEASGSPQSLGGLPLTGAGSGWLIPGVILAALLIVVAVWRRRRAHVTVDKG